MFIFGAAHQLVILTLLHDVLVECGVRPLVLNIFFLYVKWSRLVSCCSAFNKTARIQGELLSIY